MSLKVPAVAFVCTKFYRIFYSTPSCWTTQLIRIEEFLPDDPGGTRHLGIKDVNGSLAKRLALSGNDALALHIVPHFYGLEYKAPDDLGNLVASRCDEYIESKTPASGFFYIFELSEPPGLCSGSPPRAQVCVGIRIR